MPQRFALPLTVVGLLVCLTGNDVLAASDFAVPAFRQQWEQDESTVTNFWGPLALAANGQYEQYAYDNPCMNTPQEPRPCDLIPDYLRRTVQYFDKGRMELNNLAGRPRVSSGLLV